MVRSDPLTPTAAPKPSSQVSASVINHWKSLDMDHLIHTIFRESKINHGRSLKVAPPDFGLSTISAISAGTSLLYSEEKSSGIMWRKETTTTRPCSNTITDAPRLTVKATAEDPVVTGRSRAGCRRLAATSHQHPTLHIDPRPPMLHLQPPDQLPSRELGH